ncbi:uncharacterized protein LOC143222063 [Tachypleus tridentatus]|uniref:uncharacterized protein LOC143222063 n=1 Tax=Tachypleus tridentatus TaxID=6853 RepID=UPI003FD5E7BD
MMGCKVSRSGSKNVQLTHEVSENGRESLSLEPVILSRPEVNDILEEDRQHPGTYILYEDLNKEKMYLAFKTVDGKVVHNAIVKMNDLFYFNDFPFPYLESIVLYYRKYKFKDTKLTRQAFLTPYLNKMNSSRQCRYLTRSESFQSNNSWEYGHYKSLSPRLG